MKLSTALPLAHLFFRHWHVDDTEVGVVVAKARFVLADDGAFYVAPEMPELAMADVFAGDPATTPLVVEQDIAPAKIGTDVTMRGTAYAPWGAPLTDWPVALAIADGAGEARLTWGFHVRGRTEWQRDGRRWRQSRAEPTTWVPLDYALAFGGMLLDGEGRPVDFYPENPAGIGFATPEALNGRDVWPAAQIGELGEFMAGGDPTTSLSVRGFGPVAKTWLPRRALAGTFDATWEATRHPRMPVDYDLAFWNAAPTALQCRPGLRGDETITLTGITACGAPLVLRLPGAGMGLRLTGDTDAERAMVLDTVTLDLTDAPMLEMTWRALIQQPDAHAAACIAAYRIAPQRAGA